MDNIFVDADDMYDFVKILIVHYFLNVCFAFISLCKLSLDNILHFLSLVSTKN